MNADRIVLKRTADGWVAVAETATGEFLATAAARSRFAAYIGLLDQLRQPSRSAA